MGSLVLYAFALLTSEICYLLSPVYMVASWLLPRLQDGDGQSVAPDRRRLALRLALPHVAVALLLGATWLGLTSTDVQPPSGSPPAPSSARKTAKRALKRVVAPLPLHFALLSEHHRSLFYAPRMFRIPQNWAIAIVAAALTMVLARRESKTA